MSRVMQQGDFRPMAKNREAMADLIAILEARKQDYARAEASARYVRRDGGAEPRQAEQNRVALVEELRRVMAEADRKLSNGNSRIDFKTDPSRYRHWKLSVDGDVATLTMDVDQDAPLFEGYQLKLNSYDLGVDIELADALERLRFEHPAVRVVCCAPASRGFSVPAPTSACWPAPATRIR